MLTQAIQHRICVRKGAGFVRTLLFDCKCRRHGRRTVLFDAGNRLRYSYAMRRFDDQLAGAL